MNNSKAKILIKKYLDGTCSPEEKTLLESWYFSMAHNQEDETSELDYDQIGKEIWNKLPVQKQSAPSMIRLWPRYAAAAIILFILSFSVYFISNQRHTESSKSLVVKNDRDILPGGNKATLILADGSSVVLGNLKKGVIANEENAVITKNEEGYVVYNVNAKETVTEVELNTLSTPNGGTYLVELSDGTKVWLNAATSLKYPTMFKGKERLVELTGEAYFEVAKNKEMPFRVKSNDQVVEVLGTHFNINTYSNEPDVKTTLLEGSVRIKQLSSGVEKLLVPGQKAVLKPLQSGISLQKTNLDDAIAWKNGEFSFHNSDLKAIMRQLERWYSIEVKYEGNVVNQSFGGSTFRNENLSEVLKVLELGGVRFKKEGNVITVYPSN
ncbi:FecR family protein [Solitalea koreensis]|uniref:FecR family protein n=1 Tax=Solitalea koreensis TaxID=543615 RepID=A0A521AVJ7_9SPHI|nr:FecR family protein [Solitalea koreensis]SMO38814.1 FecR family protein [Solitalea koreensis]